MKNTDTPSKNPVLHYHLGARLAAPVVITDKANYAFSVCRVDSGDTTVLVAFDDDDGRRAIADLTPAEARLMAGALLRAADLVEPVA